MKILNAEQVRALDNFTIQNKPIKSIDLMENAARQCTSWLLENYANTQGFYIFCGRGNNGGDGLAIARQLLDEGMSVHVFIIAGTKPGSKDFEINLSRLTKAHSEPIILNTVQDIPKLIANYALVDALIGSGLKQPTYGLTAEIIKHINTLSNPVISIDIPSGLFMESNEQNNYSTIIQAAYTLSLELPKLAFLFPTNDFIVGKWHLLPIGLSQEYLGQVHSPYTYMTETIARKLRKTRKKFSHKGSFGHVKVVAGSEGMIGAAVLTSKAALKAGAGLVTAHIPHNMATVFHSTAPEIMVEASDSHQDVQSGLETLGYTLAIGPGLGSSELAHNLVSNAIKQSQTPIAIDADALNILSSNPTWLDDLPKNSILTPHPKEFSRLVGAWENETEKLSKLTTFCYDKQCILVLKGAHTVLCNPEGNLWFNSTGNPGLATAGSGDVLTGIITSLLAQGYLPINAALLGVYLHGLSADIALERESVESLTALNIIEFLGRAFNALQR